MPRLHPAQYSFTGGELSQRLAGRVDLAKYSTGAETLENVLLLAQGGVTRRPGTRYLGMAHDNAVRSRLIPFKFSETQVYMLEFGNTTIRIWTQAGALIESSPGVPMVITSPYTESQLSTVKFVQSADVLYLVQPDQQPRKLERYSQTVWKLRIINFNGLPSYEYGLRAFEAINPSATTGDINVVTAFPQFLLADVGREIVIIAGANTGARGTITAYNLTTDVTLHVTEPFANTVVIPYTNWKMTGSPQTEITPDKAGPAGATVNLTLTDAGFRPQDLGKIVAMNGGNIVLTSYLSANGYDGVILGEMSSDDPAPSGSWALEEASWSLLNGFPAAVGFFEDRLFFGGSGAQPNALWGSKTGDYENFALGILDDDALDYRLNSRENNRIQWIEKGRVLLVGTSGEEFRITGAPNGPLTPSNVDAKDDTTYGSSTVKPLRVGNVVLFLQSSGKNLQELVYNFDADSYVAPDMMLLAEHLTRTHAMQELAYQQMPNGVVWAVRDDGVLPSLTYKRDQDVVGWCRQVTRAGDVIESVACIPHQDRDRDQVWLIVKRFVEGGFRRYVERFDDKANIMPGWPELQTDSALTYSGAPATVFSGAGHLNGCLVDIIGDGAVYLSQVMVGGAVTISPAASKVEIGLHYKSTILTMRPETPISGTSQGQLKRWNEIIVRLENTVGCKINGTQLPFRTSAMPMDQGVLPLTDDYRVSELGWNRDGQILIEQDQPLPMTVLMITGTLNVGT